MFTNMLSKRIIGNPILRQCARHMTEVTSAPAIHERSINRVTLLGRVGSDPQKRGTEAHPVVLFSLATHSNYKTDGVPQQTTEWHRISVFNPSLRELVCNYVKKGKRVHVTGKISYGEVKDGDRILSITSIIAEEVIFFA